jgi:hypothetical protein
MDGNGLVFPAAIPLQRGFQRGGVDTQTMRLMRLLDCMAGR